MEWDNLQVGAGIFSSMMFASGTLSMLIKTLQTREVESYSFSSLLLNNIGNLVYWLYILSLPFGPIYFLHLFYTVAMILMLLCYLVYHECVEKKKTQAMSAIQGE